jgi:hypothetical protein
MIEDCIECQRRRRVGAGECDEHRDDTAETLRERINRIAAEQKARDAKIRADMRAKWKAKHPEDDDG